MKVVAYVLYIWDVADARVWSRYVAGLVECVRALPHVFPGYVVHLTLGADTLELLDGAGRKWWADELRKVVAQAWKVKYFEVDRSRRDLVACSMRPLLRRYDCVGDMPPDVEVLAFRDVDSPPTPADAAAVKACAATADAQVLLVRLPVYSGAEESVCGGGVTFFNLDKYRDELATAIARIGVSLPKSAWGADETRLGAALRKVALRTYVFECYFCAHCVSYHTTPDLSCPVVDRMDDDCGVECHRKLITAASSRYDRDDGAPHPCCCGVYDPRATLPNLLRNAYYASVAEGRVWVGRTGETRIRSWNCGCHPRLMGNSLKLDTAHPDAEPKSPRSRCTLT